MLRWEQSQKTCETWLKQRDGNICDKTKISFSKYRWSYKRSLMFTVTQSLQSKTEGGKKKSTTQAYPLSYLKNKVSHN